MNKNSSIFTSLLSFVSGFSPTHGLFSPEPGHAIDHVHNDHPTSYAAQGQSDALAEQQPVDPAAAVAEHTEPGSSADDTRNGRQLNKLNT